MRPTDPFTRPPRCGSPHPHASVHPTTAVLRSVFLDIPKLVRDKVYSHVIGVKDKIYAFRIPTANADQLTFKYCQIEAEADKQPNCEVMIRARKHSGCHALDTALSFTCRKIHDEFLRYLYTYHHLVLLARHLSILKFSDLAAQLGTYARSIRVLSLHDVFITDSISADKLQISRIFAIGLIHLKSLTVHGNIAADATHDGFTLHEEGIINWFRPLAILPLQHAEVHLDGYRQIERHTLLQLERRAVAMLLKDPKAIEERQVGRPKEQLDARRKILKNRESAKYHFNERSLITRNHVTKLPQESSFEDPAHRAPKRRRLSL